MFRGQDGGPTVDENTQLSRRDALRLGAVVGGALIAGALVGCSDNSDDAGAATSTSTDPGGTETKLAPVSHVSLKDSAPPLVDRVAVWSLVDNAHDIFLKSATVGEGPLRCEIQRNGLGLGPRLKNQQLKSEFGLGFHLESIQGDQKRHYLLDYGLSETAGPDNIAFLKIDPASVDALILSHGHYDHFGGLVPLLARHRKAMRKDLDLYVGGEDSFCYRWFPAPQGAPETERQTFGVLDRRDLDKQNVRVVMAEEPLVIGDQAFTTGAIPRTTFETVQPAAQIELGQRDGAGCDASHFTPAEQAGQIVPDQFWFEHATCFNVKDRGLVVISSCGHAGIVNTVKAAQAASGVDKVHAVIGGFHLAPAPEPVVAQTVEALKAINPDYLIPMHCSGKTFTRLADAAMPGKIIPNSTGSRFTFGAA
jgi:7,8-dihydropterin-6-yl-methyl-4-(beta-D-ribofuranosyl)aminobenzene 5'-phosphate synthase